MSHADRLRDLRALLREDGLDGVLVPRTDSHLGAAVPAASERLAWLTGFTGSAGMALVLHDRACLFTDGRYLLQAADEIDFALWQRRHMHEVGFCDWIAERDDPAGLRIGYDPGLIAEPVLELLGQAGVCPVPCRSPIDRLWQDRPPLPAGPLRRHPDALAGQTAAERRRAVAAILRQDGQDGVVLADPTQIAWLLNLRGDDLSHTPVALCVALLHADARASLFVSPERVPDAVAAALGAEVEILPPQGLDAVLSGCRGRRIRLDPARTPVGFAQALDRAGAQVVRAADPCLLPRARKTAAERAAMRAAHHADGIALCRFLHWLGQHGTEHDEHQASERLLALRREHAEYSGNSFESISASGANAALMHYHPRPDAAAPIAAGAFYLIDSGGQYPGATTDVTRTVWMGGGAPPVPLAAEYTLVLKAHVALADAVFPDGTSGHRLDLLARLPLWRAGLEFDHGAGHGLGSGLAVHEWPLAFTPRVSAEPVHAGMVLTNEPGHYVPGSHGIRIENAMETLDAPVGPPGRFLRFETLTLAPIDRRAILVELLDGPERGWLDRYHARVCDTLQPRLDPDCGAWLEAACRPI